MTVEENRRAWEAWEGEVVKWSDDDGSAANEPEPPSRSNPLGDPEWHDLQERLASMHVIETAKQISFLKTTIDQLQGEIAMVRELVSRLPEDDGSETPSTGVQADIDRVCDHLFKGHTDDKQRAKLTTSIDRAERVRPGSDAAVGRALR
jgi:hypothetical protein